MYFTIIIVFFNSNSLPKVMNLLYNLTMSTMKKLSDIAPHKQLNLDNKNQKPKTSKLAKIHPRHWTKKHWIIVISASLVVLAAIGFLIYSLLHKPDGQLTANHINQPTAAKNYYSPLTGRKVNSESDTKLPVLAVMIENSPEARPQSGLKDAGVVFEAVAEGGITRFVALYQESKPSLIGPVRSVRAYYLDWAAAFKPGVAHVGGSTEALNMLKGGNYGLDLDQSSNDSAFWRTRDRKSPHNVYTDYNHLYSLAKSKGKTESSFTGFVRKSEKTESEPASDKNIDEKTEAANSIKLAVSTGQFAVSYTYDADSKTYKRSQGGAAHNDREKGQISPDVVIAIRVNQTLQADGNHNTIGTTGSGECYVFQDGKVIKGNWSKSGPTGQIKFTDAAGKDIELSAGQTWITAVPNGKDISWQ